MSSLALWTNMVELMQPRAGRAWGWLWESPSGVKVHTRERLREGLLHGGPWILTAVWALAQSLLPKTWMKSGRSLKLKEMWNASFFSHLSLLSFSILPSPDNLCTWPCVTKYHRLGAQTMDIYVLMFLEVAKLKIMVTDSAAICIPSILYGYWFNS